MSNDDDNDGGRPAHQPASEQKVKMTTKEEGQMIRARAFLNRMDKKVQEKDETVKQIRYACSSSFSAVTKGFVSIS